MSLAHRLWVVMECLFAQRSPAGTDNNRGLQNFFAPQKGLFGVSAAAGFTEAQSRSMFQQMQFLSQGRRGMQINLLS